MCCQNDIQSKNLYFSGIVTRKGMSVREDIQVGDKVWGVVPVHRSGCHAEYIVVDENCVSSQY